MQYFGASYKIMISQVSYDIIRFFNDQHIWMDVHYYFRTVVEYAMKTGVIAALLPSCSQIESNPDIKVHGANMGPMLTPWILLYRNVCKYQ